MAVTTNGLAPDAVTSRLRTSLTGTPGMLRAGLTACLIALVLFGLLATRSVGDRRDALADARAAAAQAVIVQQVHTSLVEADALATNAFLVGGLEPADLRDGYTRGIETATTSLATAAGHASGGVLADLEAANAALARYAGLIESARANNRQGFPVGVAYLRQASQLLELEVLPRLVEVTRVSQDDVDDAYDRSGTARWGLWIAGLLVVAALVACQVLLSRATRRTLNVGLVIASGLAVVAFAWGAIAMSRAGSRADDVRGNEYRDAVHLADARIAAFGAKSQESLGLINRGNAVAFEERWAEEHAAAIDALTAIDDDSTGEAPSVDEIGRAFDDYAVVHGTVRDTDDAGDWDGAVAIATGFAADQSNGAFETFDEASAARLDVYASAIDRELDDAGGPLGTPRLAIILLTVLAGAVTVWGFNLRMKEYR